MKLSNRKSYMTNLSEGVAPEPRKSKFTQRIYIIILLCIIGYLLYNFIQRFYIFEAKGFVEVEKLIISSAKGGRISSFDLKENERFSKEQPLVVIENKTECKPVEDNRIEKLTYEIAADRALLNSYNRQMAEQQNLLQSKSTLTRALELEKSILVSNKKDNDDILKAVNKLKNDAALLSAQIKLKATRLNDLNTKFLTIEKESKCFNEQINAPFDGVVYSIQRKKHEVIVKSESIMTIISDSASVSIESYLDMSDYKSLQVGQKLELEFPDNTTGTAIVHEIVSSAYDTPDRNWDHYKPLEPHVRIHLIPENETEQNRWKKFDQLEVIVRGEK